MPQPAPAPLHGAVDLAARKAFMLQREALVTKVLVDAGLMCPCGQRIRGAGVRYFVVQDVQQGDQSGVAAQAVTCCRKSCDAARQLEEIATARVDTASGSVTWLDEKRAASAKADAA